jgi:hypothetical protein
VLRNGKLERVQCKFVRSDGVVVNVRCESRNNWSVVKYTPSTIDAIIAYDATSDKTYFVPSDALGMAGRTVMSLRLTPPRNNQAKKILYARDYEAW